MTRVQEGRAARLHRIAHALLGAIRDGRAYRGGIDLKAVHSELIRDRLRQRDNAAVELKTLEAELAALKDPTLALPYNGDSIAVDIKLILKGYARRVLS